MAKMIKFLEADKQLLDKLIELTMALNAYEETNSTDRQKSRQPMELNTNLNCWKNMQEKLSQQETQVNRNPDWVAPYNIESLAQSLGIDLPQAFSNNNSNCQTNFEQEKASSFMASSSGTSNLLILPPKSPTVRSCEKSYTEKVPVQSSAHVSFIVGKQGAKIRQIRTETETHIKTPVNGEEPIFELTGRPAKVQMAKERILEEARNFSLSLYNRACNFKEGDRRMMNLYLPARYIGLVVGKKGASIKRIMDMSGVTIVTPKVNTINIFELYGTDYQLRKAVDCIKLHIMSNNNVTITEKSNQVEITLLIEPK